MITQTEANQKLDVLCQRGGTLALDLYMLASQIVGDDPERILQLDSHLLTLGESPVVGDDIKMARMLESCAAGIRSSLDEVTSNPKGDHDK